jgi:hypothetical protein
MPSARTEIATKAIPVAQRSARPSACSPISFRSLPSERMKGSRTKSRTGREVGAARGIEAADDLALVS